MEHVNIEVKARCEDHEPIRKILKANKAIFQGIDHQIDTYFNVNHGRLKLREGNIERVLIYYNRENISGPKKSDILLYNLRPGIKEILEKSLGVWKIVDKIREIYWVNNVKFHLDYLKDLGKFAEIEVIGRKKSDIDKLYTQCNHYMQLFGIKEEDLVNNSYSDMIKS